MYAFVRFEQIGGPKTTVDYFWWNWV